MNAAKLIVAGFLIITTMLALRVHTETNAAAWLFEIPGDTSALGASDPLVIKVGEKPIKKKNKKSMSKNKPDDGGSQGEQPDLSQVIQKCGYVHMDYLQGGGSRTIPYKCTPPTISKCGNFNRDTKLAKCCCVSPGYSGNID